MILDKKHTAITDAELVQQILQGDKALQSELYDRYNGKIYYKCLSITKNKEVAKDITHDIFIKIFTKLHTFAGKADFSFWIYAITYNTCMKHLRKEKNNLFTEIEDEIEEEVQDLSVIDASEKILLELQLNQLKELMGQMKPHHRLMLLMRYQDGMSIKDISSTLKMSESAVKMRLKRSRERLAEQFKVLSDG